jgi:hypothetical protein
MLRNFFGYDVFIRLIGGLMLALATSAITISDASAAEAGLLRLRCTNPTGGANWSIVVDLDHSLVDSLPATITDTWISWSDGHRGIYELERATGKLQLRAASTTGGYFLHYVCQRE